jgi:hypothetical protein
MFNVIYVNRPNAEAPTYIYVVNNNANAVYAKYDINSINPMNTIKFDKIRLLLSLI